MSAHTIIVIGAGILGVSTAIWLQRNGHRVTLVDQDAPGQAASYGNSGLLAGWAIAPITSPSLWWDAPRMLVSSRQPLFVQWRKLPAMTPWLARLMSNATDKKTRKIAHNLAPLLTDTVDQHRALAAGTPVETWINDSKINFVYRNLKAFHADAYSFRIKEAAGLKADIITGRAVQDEEPMLGSSVQCIAQMSGHGHITDPGTYVAKLAGYFAAQGGTFLQTRVNGFDYHKGRISQVQTDMGALECDRIVVTAGIWSKDLMKKLGLSIPMQAERGYHVIYKNPSQTPRNPMLIADGKFGVNPMDMGLRFAGTVELGDHHAPASNAPIRLIEHYVKRIFPNLTCAEKDTWMGFRPTLPDSTPMIGEIGSTGVFTGFGHQHVGLTGGPKTGRLLAQMISGTPPNIDMSPYAPDRFSR